MQSSSFSLFDRIIYGLNTFVAFIWRVFFRFWRKMKRFFLPPSEGDEYRYFVEDVQPRRTQEDFNEPPTEEPLDIESSYVPPTFTPLINSDSQSSWNDSQYQASKDDEEQEIEEQEIEEQDLEGSLYYSLIEPN